MFNGNFNYFSRLGAIGVCMAGSSFLTELEGRDSRTLKNVGLRPDRYAKRRRGLRIVADYLAGA
jgi:hypothetical protein